MNEQQLSKGPVATGVHDTVHDAVGDRWLRWAATAFAVAVVFHNGDHARRGADSVSTDLFWVGTAGIFVEVGLVIVVFLGDRRAPLAAATIAGGLAVAYVGVHGLPNRGWLSDPLLESGADDSSRLAAALLISAALALAAVGATVLRRRGGIASEGAGERATRSIGDVLAHPVVAFMVLGNLAVLVSSFVSLSR